MSDITFLDKFEEFRSALGKLSINDIEILKELHQESKDQVDLEVYANLEQASLVTISQIPLASDSNLLASSTNLPDNQTVIGSVKIDELGEILLKTFFGVEMRTIPNFNTISLESLEKYTKYESCLLEEVYNITEQELFPEPSPDTVIYPLDGDPIFKNDAVFNSTLLDWRPSFLNACTPLVLITEFKLIDMFFEWVIKENEPLWTETTFKKKLKHLRKTREPVIFPEFVQNRGWLRERLIECYAKLTKLRNAIVHEYHFKATDGSVQVNRQDNASPYELNADELLLLARTAVSILKYVNGDWTINEYRERILRYNLDCLARLHEKPLMGQKRPHLLTVRYLSYETELRRTDLYRIKKDLKNATHYRGDDCIFNLRYWTVRDNIVTNAYFIPWKILLNESRESIVITDLEIYRVALPDDIELS